MIYSCYSASGPRLLAIIMGDINSKVSQQDIVGLTVSQKLGDAAGQGP